MENKENDFDRIANEIERILHQFTSNSFCPSLEAGEQVSMAILTSAWIATTVQLSRCATGVRGRADAQRLYSLPQKPEAEVGT